MCQPRRVEDKPGPVAVWFLRWMSSRAKQIRNERCFHLGFWLVLGVALSPCAVAADEEILVSVGNQWLRRELCLSPSGVKTVAFRTAQGETLAETPLPVEAIVVIDGKEFLLGAKDGGQWKVRANSPSAGCCPVLRLQLEFEPVETLPDGVTITVVYEANKNAPVISKQVWIDNESEKSLRLDQIIVEQLRRTTEQRRILRVHDDYVRSTNSELRDATAHSNATECWTYPVPLGNWLAPGERFRSFRVYECLVGQEGEAELALDEAHTRLLRHLLPESRSPGLGTYVAPAKNDTGAYYRLIDQAADLGMETVVFHHGWVDGQLVSSIFDDYWRYEPRKELFPAGFADVRKLTSYARTRGLKAFFYATHDYVWFGKRDGINPDRHWVFDEDKDTVGTSWLRLHPATDWGTFLRRRITRALQEGGFEGLVLDGPYYGQVAPQSEARHPAHGDQQLGWRRQCEFFGILSAQRFFVEAAQGMNAFHHGARRIATSGYTEGDFHNTDPKTMVLKTRQGAWGFTRQFRPEQGIYFIPIESWLMGPALLPMSEHLVEINAYLANCYGYGFDGRLYTSQLYDGAETRRIVARWTEFYKQFRRFFQDGNLLHLREPDGKQVDAVGHLLDTAGERKLLVVAFNPLDTAQSGVIPLPPSEAGHAWMLNEPRDGSVELVGKVLEVKVPALDACWGLLEARSVSASGAVEK